MLEMRGFRLPRERDRHWWAVRAFLAIAVFLVLRLSLQLFISRSQDDVGEVEISIVAAKQRSVKVGACNSSPTVTNTIGQKPDRCQDFSTTAVYSGLQFFSCVWVIEIEWDEIMAAMSEDSVLAPLACDYCRNKKLRCSREKPKYANCQNWPGECQYSRQSAKRRIVRAPISEEHSRDPESESSLESRVQRIETSIGTLHSSIKNLTRLIQTSIAPENPHPSGNLSP